MKAIVIGAGIGGLSAAIALSQRVLNGGKKELDQYLSFLKGGCSKDHLERCRRSLVVERDVEVELHVPP